MVAYAIAPTPKLITPVTTLPRISQRRYGTFMWNPLLVCKVFAHQPTPDGRFGYSATATYQFWAASSSVASGSSAAMSSSSSPGSRLS